MVLDVSVREEIKESFSNDCPNMANVAVLLQGTVSSINCVCNTKGSLGVEFCSVLLIKCEQTVALLGDSCCTCSCTCHRLDHVKPVFSLFNVKDVDNNLCYLCWLPSNYY